MKEISNLVSLPRMGWVFASYIFRVITGHNVEFPGKEGKKKWVIC